MANMVHVCNGKVIYQIQTGNHLYQLEVDSTEQEWEATYLLPSFILIVLAYPAAKQLDLQAGFTGQNPDS